MESERSEFYFLKTKPEYPKTVKAIAVAHFHYDTKAKRLYFDRHEGIHWVASLWILDGSCQIDLAVSLKEGTLDFIEGYCHHGDACPKVEQVKRAILEAEAFSSLREDLIHELCRWAVADLHPADQYPSPWTVPRG